MSAPLFRSPSLTTESKPAATATLPSSSYVLSLAALPSHYAATASAPSNAIYLFDQRTLRQVSSLPGHSDQSITTLRAVDSIAGYNRRSLVSAGMDSTVRVWDERASSVAIQMSAPSRFKSLLSCDVSQDGLTVAAGTELQGDDAWILYWDPRQPAAPLRTHGSTHSEDITAVHFVRRRSESTPNILLSASSDGLVSLSAADEADEEEAVLQVGNWGCSVSQTGFVYSPDDVVRGVWAGSDMETFSLWSEELDLKVSMDIRAPSMHNQPETWVTDYLISARSPSSTSDDNLKVFVGSNEGDVALLSFPLSGPEEQVTPTVNALWTQGHVGVVRSLLYDEQNKVILTGGEDAKLNMWSIPPHLLLAEGSMDVDEEPRKQSRKREMHDGANDGPIVGSGVWSSPKGVSLNDESEGGGKRARRR